VECSVPGIGLLTMFIIADGGRPLSSAEGEGTRTRNLLILIEAGEVGEVVVEVATRDAIVGWFLRVGKRRGGVRKKNCGEGRSASSSSRLSLVNRGVLVWCE
jgi:hypothetical protein